MKKTLSNIFKNLIEDLLIYFIAFLIGTYGMYRITQGDKTNSKYDNYLEYVGDVCVGIKENALSTYNFVKSNLPWNNANEIDVSVLEDNFYYSMLSDDGKNIYEKLYKSASNFKTFVTIFDSYDEALTAITYFNNDCPEYFFLEPYNCDINIYLYNTPFEFVTMEYKGDVSEIEYTYYKDRYVSEEIVKNVADMDQYEGIKYLHDYIVNNVDYVADSKYNQDVRSSLLYGETVCAGYAKMMKYLCDAANYECIYVIGNATVSSGNPRHAWNMVCINDQYYWIDVTWDDGRGNYDYFLISDEEISKDHVSIEGFDMNLCNSNYH